jgi:hypothetical protein
MRTQRKEKAAAALRLMRSVDSGRAPRSDQRELRCVWGYDANAHRAVITGWRRVELD